MSSVNIGGNVVAVGVGVKSLILATRHEKQDGSYLYQEAGASKLLNWFMGQEFVPVRF